jgi:hypothetical protein
MRKKLQSQIIKRTTESQAAKSQNVSFLNQMGGALQDREEEVFLKEILQELRGEYRGASEPKNIREMFQLTLEVLRNIREGHEDLTKKIDEMKRALNKDIDRHGRNILVEPVGSPARLKLVSLKSISEEEGESTYM